MAWIENERSEGNLSINPVNIRAESSTNGGVYLAVWRCVFEHPTSSITCGTYAARPSISTKGEHIQTLHPRISMGSSLWDRSDDPVCRGRRVLQKRIDMTLEVASRATPLHPVRLPRYNFDVPLQRTPFELIPAFFLKCSSDLTYRLRRSAGRKCYNLLRVVTLVFNSFAAYIFTSSSSHAADVVGASRESSHSE